jgi:tetratricopeptide (TPR) repeat protein
LAKVRRLAKLGRRTLLDGRGNIGVPQVIGKSRRLHDCLKKAVALHQRGLLSNAEKIYEEILRQQPNHFDALHLLGLVALQTHRVKRGVKLIELAIMLNPRVAAAHGNIGNGLSALNRLEDAIASFDKAVALRPDYREAWTNRGIVLRKLRRYNEALTSFDKAIALRPDYAVAYNSRGNVLRDLLNCEEALISYDRAIALDPDYAEAHRNRGLVLHDLRRCDEALTSFDKAVALKPDYMEAWSNRGLTLYNLRRYDEALISFDKAIALRSDSTEVWSSRGNVLRHLRHYEMALISFDAAITLQPDYAVAHSNRGLALHDLRRYDEALVSLDTAIALKPDYAEAHSNRGLVLRGLRRYGEALVSLDTAIALDPICAETYLNKGLLLLLLGQLERGWELYEWRKKTWQPTASRFYPQPLWLGKESIAGKTLFIHWEQGFGDTLQFCRYAKLVKALGAQVIMSVQDPLLQLLRQMEPAIQLIGGKQEPTAFDYHCSLMSLPLAMSTTLETVPSVLRYLTADRQLCAQWAARLPPKTKLRIGLTWRGSPKKTDDHDRSMSLATLLPLLFDDVEWLCLQKELVENDAALLRQDGRIIFVGDDHKDFSDTAALVDLVDLVITVDTNTAHLAGAMGKPTWILLSYNSDWRWLVDRSDSPWYPSARLFRQEEMGNWADVIHRVQHELRCTIDRDVRCHAVV